MSSTIHSSTRASPDEVKLCRTDSVTTISTNATAPNLPGAGRTVGIALDWLGVRLESFMNKRAVHFNVGPEAVAREIRHLRWRHETMMDARQASPADQLPRAEAKRLKELCKKLLKYASSKTKSTQSDAVAEIMSLAIDDPALHTILAQCLINSRILTRDGSSLPEDKTLRSERVFDRFASTSDGSGSSTFWPGKSGTEDGVKTSERTLTAAPESKSEKLPSRGDSWRNIMALTFKLKDLWSK